MLWAQETKFSGIPSDNDIREYLSEAKEYATLFSGKTETPYDRQFVNHPYFESSGYLSGTLCYNRVIYKDVMMRFDLFRNELTVFLPGRPFFIVLNNEKFEYAILNGSTIVLSDSEKDSKKKFLVLLHNGRYPVVRKYNMTITEDVIGLSITSSFRIQQQYAIYVNGISRVVKNKNSVVKLFPDKRKELNEFAKQHKLSFNNQSVEQSIVALVGYYENLLEERK
jgi:hypothetical protein